MKDTLVGAGDLAERWGYTRQGVFKLMKLADFPEPLGRINANRTPVWRLSQFVEFEKAHPETQSESMKRRKGIGFYLAKKKG